MTYSPTDDHLSIVSGGGSQPPSPTNIMISHFDYNMHSIGQRIAVDTSDRAYQYNRIGNRKKTANSPGLPRNSFIFR
ncbi:MAG: hypothetical protein HC845_09570 [Akkermansiaceae bacterium]|nr:hypothetical protein [Akkermansiaceae bacterium]